jgi:hypothetical protein
MTTHVEGDKYQGLLREKGGTGFPYLVFLDADGEVLARAGDRSVEGFQKVRSAISAYQALEQKAAKGDKTVGADLLIAGIEMGKLKFADAKEAAGKLGKISAEKQKQIDALVFNLEVQDAMSSVRSQEAMIEVGKKFATMMEEGKAPTGSAARQFYSAILAAKEAEADAKGFEKAMNAMKKAAGDTPANKRMFESLDTRLARLKKGKG